MSSQNSHPQRGRPAISDDGHILDAVTDTFWAKGYTDTSISDLASASDTSRASLYKLYGDKDALLIAALGCYAQRFDRRVDDTLDQTTDPVAAIASTLRASADRLADPRAPDGCLRCRSTLELVGKSPAIDAALDRANRAFDANMRRLLNADDKARATDAATARALTATVNGMVLSAEAGATRADLEDIIDAALEVVRTRL